MSSPQSSGHPSTFATTWLWSGEWQLTCTYNGCIVPWILDRYLESFLLASYKQSQWGIWQGRLQVTSVSCLHSPLAGSSHLPQLCHSCTLSHLAKLPPYCPSLACWSACEPSGTCWTTHGLWLRMAIASDKIALAKQCGHMTSCFKTASLNNINFGLRYCY